MTEFLTCPLCEAMCGLAIETDGPRITSIRGDDLDPVSRGHICPKAVALQDLHEDPDRLRRPVKRVGTDWHEISWPEAIDLVVRELKAVQTRHGPDAIAVYLGNPTVHSLGAMLFAPPFVRALHTRNRYSATSVDQLPHHVAALWMFGHPLLIPIPDLDRTDFLLALGANPAVSNGSMMTAPDAARRIREIRGRGGRVVVVDPRRTETADVASEHHFIRPGADALLLLGLLHVILREGLEKLGRLADFTDGLAEIRQLADRFAPERVAPATGIAAETIRSLARDFARTPRAVAYGRIGISTQEFGGLSNWLVNVLNAVTGHLDEPGGAMFTRPAIDLMRGGGSYGGRGRFARWRSRVRGLPEFAGELPVAALAEEIETPGEGQVRALVTHAGNPVLSAPNGARLDRAIPSLEFFVAIDFYIDETTRHANVILPPTDALEREHYDLVFHTLAIRNSAKYSPPLFKAPAGTMHDWQILNALTWRMARGGPWQRLRARVRAIALDLMGPRGMLARGLKAGPHAATLSMKQLERSPHGVDLGALEPCFPRCLRTDDKRLQLAPPAMLADVVRLEAALDSTAAPRYGSLDLIGRRDLRSNNSWMHNSERLVRGKRRCTLLMNPADAATRGLDDAARVKVTSRTGSVEVELETTDAIMPGVVSLPHGWGHDRAGVKLRTARAHGGASINDLTDDTRLDALTGNAAFSGTAVRVEAVP